MSDASHNQKLAQYSRGDLPNGRPRLTTSIHARAQSAKRPAMAHSPADSGRSVGRGIAGLSSAGDWVDGRENGGFGGRSLLASIQARTGSRGSRTLSGGAPGR